MLSYLGEVSAALLLVLSWPNILYPVLGTFAAMVPAFLPGANGMTLMAVLLPLTLSWDPLHVMLLYGALVGGATFMGSVTAILFNVPGGAPNAATLLDGHPMAMNGQARTALACAAMASACGSTLGIFVLIALLPFVRGVILAFGPLELLMLGLWGLTTIVMLTRGSPLKGSIMAGLGIVAAMVGLDPTGTEARWTLGNWRLDGGLEIVPVLLGLFAVTEAIQLMVAEPRALKSEGVDARGGSVREGCMAVLRHRWLFVRSSLIGTLVGIVPGVGGTVASFVAYGHAVQSAEDRSRFGKGDIRGVLAPEAAHDAKDGGSLLPTLAFGLPGSEGTVILLAAMLVHGIVPGRQMMESNLPIALALIWALFISNWITSLVGLALAGRLARLAAIRTDVLGPVILALVAVGAIAYRGEQADLFVALAFGVVGYALRKHGWPRVPFIIAFVLGDVVEHNLQLSMRLASLGRLSLWDQPVALIILSLVVLTLVWALRQKRHSTAMEA
jgi:TctA family transporter